MIRYNIVKCCYEWDRWTCGNWTWLSEFTALRLIDGGERYIGQVVA